MPRCSLPPLLYKTPSPGSLLGRCHQPERWREATMRNPNPPSQSPAAPGATRRRPRKRGPSWRSVGPAWRGSEPPPLNRPGAAARSSFPARRGPALSCPVRPGPLALQGSGGGGAGTAGGAAGPSSRPSPQRAGICRRRPAPALAAPSSARRERLAGRAERRCSGDCLGDGPGGSSCS